jgi:hypothetical protein
LNCFGYDIFKNALLLSLEEIFSSKFQFEEDPESTPLYLVDETGRTEMIFVGAALRKVFTCLVLLFSLLETTQAHRIFLIEEPEAQLYPLIQQRFVQQLKFLCKDKVQLFMTTNAKDTMDLFSAKVN